VGGLAAALGRCGGNGCVVGGGGGGCCGCSHDQMDKMMVGRGGG